MLQSIENFLKFYFTKLITILTFITIWTCVLLIFTNSTSILHYDLILNEYPINTYIQYLNELENIIKIKTIISASINVLKTTIIVKKWFI